MKESRKIMFEHRGEPLLPRTLFIWRVFKFTTISFGLAAISLLVGIMGYRTFEGMAWIDAFVNAAMILGVMGPVGELHTNAGKLFAGIYALYCGLIVIISVGILIAPIFHRFMHLFHLEYKSND
jgi:phosphotransferase system  glucose/maltose/N-acetylglucosamine-specific IIC component